MKTLKINQVVWTIVIIGLILGSGCLSGPTNTPEPTIPPITSGPDNLLTISVVSVEVDTGSAIVSWTTNIESDSIVRYGMEPGKYALSQGDRGYVTSHSITLSDLLTNTTYYYRLGSVSPEGVASQSREYNFTSRYQPLPSAPVISGFSVAPDSVSAIIKWTTDVDANSLVRYGTSPAAYMFSAGNNDSTTTHQINLKNLIPGNTYYYYVISRGENGIFSESEEQSFRTIPAGSGDPVSLGDLIVRIEGLDEYQSNGGYYSKAKIDIENNASEIISIDKIVSAVLNSNGNQSSLVSLRTADEFTPLGLILPKGKISRTLYYERVTEGPGMLYISLSIPPETFSFEVFIDGPIPSTPAPLNLTIEEQIEETQENIEVVLEEFESRIELILSGRSRLLSKADFHLKNNGEVPIPIRFNPVPGIVEDNDEQHSRFITNNNEELKQTTLLPGGSISGSFYFIPEIPIIANNVTIYLYINEVEFIFPINISN